MGTIRAVCISKIKHTRKEEVDQAEIQVGHGVVGDAHAGSKREVSLLASESIDKMRADLPELAFGDFAENLTTEGLPWEMLSIGTRLNVGEDIVLEVMQIGKRCHNKCDIFKTVGYCIMPTEGVFARVVNGGVVRKGDGIEIV